MSFDDVLTLVMLVLCILLAALVAYLISKVNELELKTSNFLKSNQTHNKANNDVFGGLQGKQLWDAWQVAVSTSVDELGLDRDRDRLMMLLELHVRELVAAGKASGLSPSSDTPGDVVTLKTLRGDFQSYLPTSFTESFVACGKKIGSASSDEERIQAISELEKFSRRLGAMVLADDDFSNRIASLYI